MMIGMFLRPEWRKQGAKAEIVMGKTLNLEKAVSHKKSQKTQENS